MCSHVLQGVGYPLDIVVCSALGADMYDCVYPTRTARFGTALVPEVKLAFHFNCLHICNNNIMAKGGFLYNLYETLKRVYC